MRRQFLFLAGLLLAAASACVDSTLPIRSTAAPTAGRYQLSASGTLADEITALSLALFPNGLETAAGTRWELIKSKLAAGDVTGAQARLLDLVRWIKQRQPQMDTPPNGESRDAATARLILYMSLYVYQGASTPVPDGLGSGIDAVAVVVSPDSQTVVQTPLKHAGARFDAGTVSENTIVVISQNTQLYASHCSGPFTTKYCQYPLYYHYQSFPVQKFLKPVHLAVCHIHTGDNYGPLAGVDHDKLVMAHDKPASSANYTPGGYPVPGESVEILPRSPTFDPTHPLIACTGSVYPQVAYFEYSPTRHDLLGRALASAARGVNRALGVVGDALTPRSAFAIDVGPETETSFFSNFVNVDTMGHPDLALTSVTPPGSATAGQSVTISYVVANNGTAPSPAVNTTISIVPFATSYVPIPVTLTPTAVTGNTGTLFPLESRTQTATVTIPSTFAPGSYTLNVFVSSSGGLSELTSTSADNGASVPIAITGLGRFATTTVDGVFSAGEWDESKCVPITATLPGGATAPAKYCWQNDAQTLYVGVKVSTPTDVTLAGLGIFLDANNTGAIDAGDDAFVANRQDGFFDDWFTSCALTTTSAGDCSYPDTMLGGVSNGTGAWTFNGNAIIAEASHPLNSADPYDMAIAAGQTIGVRFNLRFISGSTVVDNDYPTATQYTPLYTYTGSGPFYSVAAPSSARTRATSSSAAVPPLAGTVTR